LKKNRDMPRNGEETSKIGLHNIYSVSFGKGEKMTFEKAIETLKSDLENPYRFIPPDSRNATQLGLEALEFLKRWRDKAEIQPYPLLRSETLD